MKFHAAILVLPGFDEVDVYELQRALRAATGVLLHGKGEAWSAEATAGLSATALLGATVLMMPTVRWAAGHAAPQEVN